MWSLNTAPNAAVSRNCSEKRGEVERVTGMDAALVDTDGLLETGESEPSVRRPSRQTNYSVRRLLRSKPSLSHQHARAAHAHAGDGVGGRGVDADVHAARTIHLHALGADDGAGPIDRNEPVTNEIAAERTGWANPVAGSSAAPSIRL